MKSLWRLNKYFVKYKGYLLMGILFTIISNVFVIIPAQLVRIAIDYVVESFAFYRVFADGELASVARGQFMNFIIIL